MIVKNETLTTLKASFKSLFDRGLNAVELQWKKVATEFKSSTASNIYGWLGKFPMMREWVGQRTINSMKESGYQLTNKKFETTVGVSREDIEDDNIGIYSPIFEQMGQSAQEHIDINVFAALANGFTVNCFDGKPYFSAEHPINSKEDGTGTAGTFSNILKPTATSGTPWFLIDNSKVVKPVIYQNRKDAQFDVKTDAASSDHVFMSDEFLYGASARRAFGYSFPQLAIGCRDELTAANFEAAYKMLLQMKTDGNRPLNTKATLLVIPPELYSEAVAILETQFIKNQSNPNYHKIPYIVTPYLTATATSTDDSSDDTSDDNESSGSGES